MLFMSCMVALKPNAVVSKAVGTVSPVMGRMHGDARFAGSSSVPAHEEMMGLIGAGANPIVCRPFNFCA